MALTIDGSDPSGDLGDLLDAKRDASLPVGKILQVVSVSKTDTFSTTASSWTSVTGLSASITPSSSLSKVLVSGDVFAGLENFYGLNFFWRITRNGTPVGVGTTGSLNVAGGHNMYQIGQSVPFAGGLAKTFLDSPSSTSSVTYQIQINKNDASSTIYVNRRGSDSSTVGISSITLMEVSA